MSVVLFAALAIIQIGHFANHATNLSSMRGTEEKVQVKPDDEMCSSGGADCSGTQCCTGAGYRCYRKNSYYSGCLREGACTPAAGWQCQERTKVVEKPNVPTSHD